MYHNNFVAVVKNNGSVLRELSDQSVLLPFGSEYSLLLKNLDLRRRVLVDIIIDGSPAVSNIVLAPDSSTEIERFHGQNNMAGNRFKFIERTLAVEQFRGIKACDGLIEVKFKFEAVVQHLSPVWPHWNKPPTPSGWSYPQVWPPFGVDNRGVTGGSSQSVMYGGCGSGGACSSSSYQPATAAYRAPEAPGITVPGSISKQYFEGAAWFPTDSLTESALVFRLVGANKNQVITKPYTVKTMTYCNSCGASCKPPARYCSQCGTSIEYVV